jgi:hypothetical protein
MVREVFLAANPDRSVDDLLVVPDDAKAFAKAVIERAPGADETAVLRQLIRLRKLGEARGGLPRRERTYRGRRRSPK